MRDLRRSARIAFMLCVAALIAGLVAAAAVSDIYHGEPDLRSEWRALQTAALLILAALITAARVLYLVAVRVGRRPQT
jgi:hypothetical protein